MEEWERNVLKLKNDGGPTFANLTVLFRNVLPSHRFWFAHTLSNDLFSFFLLLL